MTFKVRGRRSSEAAEGTNQRSWLASRLTGGLGGSFIAQVSDGCFVREVHTRLRGLQETRVRLAR